MKTEELETFKNLPYVQRVDKLTEYDYSKMNKILFGFLDYFESV